MNGGLDWILLVSVLGPDIVLMGSYVCSVCGLPSELRFVYIKIWVRII
jgi:hypothetical protein